MKTRIATGPSTPPLARFADAVLAAIVLVVLWGAYVRATGSGAGCGRHWPLCNGEVVPRAPRLETLIELTHRATSGLAMLLVAALVVAVFRSRPKGDPARGAAVGAAILMATEAAVGAALVLFRLVAENESMARALMTGAHLLNTFLLIAALTAVAYASRGLPPARRAGDRELLPSIVCVLVGWLVVGSSGTVAALGDTLHPARTIEEALAQDLSATSQVLLRLRIVHPFLAIGVAVFVLLWASGLPRRRPDPAVRRAARWTSGLVLLQMLAGTTNMALLAPVWMQLVHLLLADLVWIASVVLSLAALAAPPPQKRMASARMQPHAEEL